MHAIFFGDSTAFPAFAVPFITHWYKLNEAERNNVEAHLLDSKLDTCVQIPDAQQMLG